MDPQAQTLDRVRKIVTIKNYHGLVYIVTMGLTVREGKQLSAMDVRNGATKAALASLSNNSRV